MANLYSEKFVMQVMSVSGVMVMIFKISTRNEDKGLGKSLFK